MIFIVNTECTRAKFIAQSYSRNNQTVKTLEELSELQKALSKLLIAKNNNQDYAKEVEFRGNVEEEIADVLIMLNQMIYLWDVSESRVVGMINYKLDRQIKRIENGE